MAENLKIVNAQTQGIDQYYQLAAASDPNLSTFFTSSAPNSESESTASKSKTGDNIEDTDSGTRF